MEVWELNWKRILRWLLALLAISYLLWFVLLRPSPDSYYRCEYYTEHLNGGVRTFQGKQYNIVLCGLQGRIDPGNVQYDEVRLMVLSMDGELLAERYYEPWWNLMELEYGDDYLAYVAMYKSGTQKIAMPPTRLDWLRARLPRLWPSYPAHFW